MRVIYHACVTGSLESVDFYRKAFDAKLECCYVDSEGKFVEHAEPSLDGQILKDEADEVNILFGGGNMKSWYKEDYTFKVTVVSVEGNGNPEGHCRNGHEVGDTYTCEYGCPGGFCSKSMFRLFSLMEAVRAGGSLSNLLMGASKHSGEFSCHDGVVRFKLEARGLAE